MRIILYNKLIIIVAPFGWCVHFYFPEAKRDAFLVKCAETHLFKGIDIEKWGWRLIALRVNHIEHDRVLDMVENYEKKLKIRRSRNDRWENSSRNCTKH